MNPCYGCQSRVVGCHGKCADYQRYNEERQEVLKENAKKVRQNNDYMAAKAILRKTAIKRAEKG